MMRRIQIWSPNYPFAHVRQRNIAAGARKTPRRRWRALTEAIGLEAGTTQFAHATKGETAAGAREDARKAVAYLDEVDKAGSGECPCACGAKVRVAVRNPGSAGRRQGALMRQWRLIHLVPLYMGRDEGGFSGLDPGTRHCLVDTMVLLQMRQGDPDVIGDAKRELRGAALVLLDIIAVEAVHRHGKQDGGHGMADPKDFVSFLSGLLKSRDIRFKLVRVEQGMYASVLQMLYDRAHPRLSEADCTLLSAAVGCPDMDVMTNDKALADAINSERGPKAKGRVLDAMSSHHGRRQSTAKLIRNRLGSYIPKGARVEWYDRFHHTVFLIAGATVSIDHVEKGRVRVDLRPLVAKPDKKILKIQSELEVEVRERFFRPEIQWVQERLRKETGAGKGPAHAELGYGDHADGLDGETKRRLERKLRGKGIGGRDP